MIEHAAFAELKGEVDNLRRTCNGTKERIDEFRSEIRTEFQKVHERFDAADKRSVEFAEAVGQRFENVEKAQELLRESLEGVLEVQ